MQLKLPLVIPFSVKNAKLVSTFTVKQKKLNPLMVTNNKIGNVNSVTLETKLILKKKRNPKLMLSITSLRLQLRCKIKKHLERKRFLLSFVLINLDQCVFLNQLKEKFRSKETKLKSLINLSLSVMVLTNFYKVKEM